MNFSRLFSLFMLALICVGLFFVLQWIIPGLAGIVGLTIPSLIVNIIAFIIALGVFYSGYTSWWPGRGGPIV